MAKAKADDILHDADLEKKTTAQVTAAFDAARKKAKDIEEEIGSLTIGLQVQKNRIDWLAKDLAKRFGIAAPVQAPAPISAGKKSKPGKTVGSRKDVPCRALGCKKISKGSRFAYFCEDHRKGGTANASDADRAKWTAIHKAKVP